MLHPCASFLLFYSSRAHRDLHSFPTRRSSDLVLDGGRLRGEAVVGQRVGHDAVDLFGHAAVEAAQPEEINRIDRKSTRLNSSHRTISYAVFCLKKKKTKYANSLKQEHIIHFHK